MSDQARDGDIVELGRGPGQRFRLPDGWRPSRGAAVFAAAALVVGLAAGYAAGSHQARGGAARPEPASSAAAASSVSAATSAASFPFTDPAPLTQAIGECSVQSGRHLVLGVQVTNQSTVPVTLQSARAVLPLGGLTPGTWQWTTCDDIPQTLVQEVVILQPGASSWLTMTFNVKVACPAPYPVQFTISYLAQGHSATASLPGFDDLGEVPYTGCPGESAVSSSPAYIIATP
jgi:hypothetical protein